MIFRGGFETRPFLMPRPEDNLPLDVHGHYYVDVLL